VPTPWISRPFARTPRLNPMFRLRARSRRSRPAVEGLEGRQLLSTLYVTSLGDNGDNANPTPNSLRAAIVASNNAPVGTVTTIDFSIGTGAQTISLVAPLPTLANPTIIDGTTQPGYAGRPMIQVDGTQAGAGAIGFSLDDDSHNSTIKGLEITGFNGGGILDDNGNSNVFTNDVIGLHVTGTLPRVIANGTFGVEIRDQANNNTLSNLVVAGNQFNGVVINNSTGTALTGSFIGTDSSGTASLDRNGVALGNGVSGGGGSGVVINGSATNTTLSGDVIVNNESFGVLITGSGTTKNTLAGNKIGVDRTGTTALGNVLDGVAVISGASGNFIGQPGQGNVISGNGHSGVWLSGFDNAGKTSGNIVAGNFIGTNGAGSGAIPNAMDGVVVNNMATSNTIGTTDAGGSNVISGNSEWGVFISDAGTTFNVVQDDFIGTDATGKTALPNAFNGLDILNGATNNTVGGTATSARNLISGNLHEGVLIGGSGTSNNTVEGNFIGTDVTGKAFLASTQQGDGVYVGLGASNNTIGGQNPVGAFNTAAWNVISGNSTSGILVTDSGTTGTVISGNFIGTDVTGTASLPNGGNGVTIAAGTSNTTVGAETSGIANLNVISGNLGDGVSITSSSGNNLSFNYIGVDLNNQIALPNRGNGVSIHAASGNRVNLDVIRNNGGYGILTDIGATGNGWYYDSIYNNTAGGILQQGNPSPQPAPVLTKATVANGQTTITGTISGSPFKNTALVLQFYASPASTSPASIQGLTFIGQSTVTTDANGNGTFTATVNKAVSGGQIITATADFNVSSTSNFSNPVTVPTGAAATFLSTDTTTQGAWRNAYGGDGYDIPADNSATNPVIPPYATLSVTGAGAAPWTTSTTDPRALQNAAGNGRIASGWFGSTISFNLNLTDGQSHRVALYALDWDGYGGGRSERVDVLDAVSGGVLDSRTISGFGQGQYLSWNLSGNVVIRVTNLNAASNAVVNGLFFGNAAATTSATFLATDTVTQGAWRNAYGADGFDIPADQSATNPVIPAYATLSVTGAGAAPWTTSTTDPRALQNAANTGRISSGWFGSTINFNVKFVDGQAHKLALYALDWDGYGGGRSERVDVLDSSGNVLDSRTLSSFGQGVYLSWTIKGSVTIRVTNLNANSNAVVNGLFFGNAAATTSATFLATDTATQGNWHGVYGGDGYDIPADQSATNPVIPAYATLSVTGAGAAPWTTSTADVRALQNAANNGRISSGWFGSTINFNLNLTDGQAHKVTIYALDWDGYGGGRSERIDILNAATGGVLDSRTISGFGQGQYLSWNLTGNVVIRVTNLNPSSNAVVNGLFFSRTS
jgi:hypothetical protein